MSEEKGNGSLVIVGTGIKFLSHLTVEAKTHIQSCYKLLYLVNEPVMEEWLQKNHNNSENLKDIYTSHPTRLECYKAIADYVIASMLPEETICFVLYGHPCVFALPAIYIDEKLDKSKCDFKILPGISAEDCLYADLMIDPGQKGCQSYEATDFLIYQRKVDVRSHLILWQVGVIGLLGRDETYNNHIGINLLIDVLIKLYSSLHEVFIYQAAQYPYCEPFIEKVKLLDLSSAEIPRLATMYIPPFLLSEPDNKILEQLAISPEEFK
jgi:uncharacterized protein YabN with tetrapyrrole methylase and pyrophosphatase domain